jgi:hypothetical protein
MPERRWPEVTNWSPRLRPVLEEACGALLAASVLYGGAVLLGYAKTPTGAQFVYFCAGGAFSIGAVVRRWRSRIILWVTALVLAAAGHLVSGVWPVVAVSDGQVADRSGET